MLTGKRILIVDDEAVLTANLREYFSRRHAEVVHVCTGEAALDAAAEFAPDVVVVADRLPGIGGIDTIQALRTQDLRSHCVLLTDRSRDVVVAAAGEAGVDHILDKPFGMADLERTIVAGAGGTGLAEIPPLPVLDRRRVARPGSTPGSGGAAMTGLAAFSHPDFAPDSGAC